MSNNSSNMLMMTIEMGICMQVCVCLCLNRLMHKVT